MNLFGKEPRPTFNAELKNKLAEQIGTEVHKWLAEKDTPVEDVIADTRKILEYHHNDNGYEIAREFEDAGYSPDAELVEILEGVGFEMRTLLSEAIKSWVIADDIKPELAEGTPVIVQYGRNKVEGIITGAYHSTAEYQVCIPSEGMSLENTKTRAVIKYENAWPIVQEQEIPK